MTEAEIARALSQRQRLDLLGDMVGGLGHELNNALSVASGQAELTAERLDLTGRAPEVVAEMRKVVEWVQRASKASAQLVEVFRTARGPRGRLDLGDLVQSTAELFRYRCEREGLILAVEPGEPAPYVDGDPGPLQQAMANLIQNSRQALIKADEGGIIRVAAAAVGDVARVEVEDDGPGIPPAEVERVFDPLYTSRTGVPGAGLGLTVARWVARDHGGDLHLSCTADGTLARLEIPLIHD